MNRIKDRIVLITGASSGIGKACARAFAEKGARLALAARRAERLEELGNELTEAHGVEVRAFGLDVRDHRAVERLRQELDETDFMPEVLINNAGKAKGLDPIQSGDLDHWDEMIDTNVKGLLYVTRAFLPRMVELDRGHVVNIGSISGMWVYPDGAAYCATKFAVRALNLGMNIDLCGTKVRVSSVDPGAVDTEFSEVRFDGDRERADKVYEGFQPLRGEDVADAVCYVVNAPEHVDVFSIMLMPTAQRHAQFLHRADT